MSGEFERGCKAARRCSRWADEYHRLDDLLIKGRAVRTWRQLRRVLVRRQEAYRRWRQASLVDSRGW